MTPWRAPASMVWIWSRLSDGNTSIMRSSAWRGVVGVQSREHEVAGLGQAQCDLDRLEVAHLTEQHDVGVFTQRAAQPLLEADGVGADLALVDHRHLVVVEVLDRVFDREDVDRLGLVDPVDHRRQRGRLARTGRAHCKHQTIRSVEQGRDRRGAHRAPRANAPGTG